MSYGVSSVFVIYRHFLTILRMSSYRQVHSALVFTYIIAHNGIILSGDGMNLKLLRKGFMSLVVLADHKYTGGIHVDPVDYARSELAVDG